MAVTDVLILVGTRSDRIKVFLLPLNATPELTSKSKFHRLFNVVYFSNRSAHSKINISCNEDLQYSSDYCVAYGYLRIPVELSK